MIGRLKTLAPGKPTGISSWGMGAIAPLNHATLPPGTEVSTVALKSTWIRDLFSYVQSSPVRMLISWNYDMGVDNAVFSGPDWANKGDEQFTWLGALGFNGYSAYRLGIANPAYIDTHGGGGRLLTDAEFLGL